MRPHVVVPVAVVLLGCSSAAAPSHSSDPITTEDAGTGAKSADSGPRVDSGVTRDAARGRDTGPEPSDADLGQVEASLPDASADAPGDASNACAVSGAPGECMTLPACTALGDHTSFSGYCPGPASIECCIVTPSTADNPATPAGYVLMTQAAVTPAMTAWAVMILNDPSMYPMFSTTTQTFGSQLVLARVEWHPPDFQNSVVHRGVTLYVPV
jgi:hypothetical protein